MIMEAKAEELGQVILKGNFGGKDISHYTPLQKMFQYNEKSVWLIQSLFSASGVIYQSHREVLTAIKIYSTF